MPRASLEAVVLDMVATGHPINEGELEVAATEDEACLGACAVAPAAPSRSVTPGGRAGEDQSSRRPVASCSAARDPTPSRAASR